MAQEIYIIQKGDTLSEIAERLGTTVSALLKLNPDIPEPGDMIVAGEPLVTSGDANTKTVTKVGRPKIVRFGLLSTSEDTLFAKWSWDKEQTKSYHVVWQYLHEGGVWLLGESKSITIDEYAPEYSKQDTFRIPEGALCVKFKVMPIAESTSNGILNALVGEKVAWIADWSTEKSYNVVPVPKDPGTPTVSIDKKTLKLTATLDNLEESEYNSYDLKIRFRVVKDDADVAFATVSSEISSGHAACIVKIAAGSNYKVQAQGYYDTRTKAKIYGEWSDYSGNTAAPPSAPDKITECRAKSETAVYISWSAVRTAKTYEIEYATDKNYFDTREGGTTTVSGIEKTYRELELKSGKTYFFRVRAVGDGSGTESTWTGISSVTIGSAPAAPTTWSSVDSVTIGEKLYLYWIHNSEDSSKETYAYLELTADGTTTPITVEKDDEDDSTISVYEVDTTDYPEGTELTWRVRTRGAIETLGDWSVERVVHIWQTPTLALSATDYNGKAIETLSSLPINISAVPYPNTQAPVSYYLEVISNSSYATLDNKGVVKNVAEDEVVYAKYFDISTSLSVVLSAGDISLANNALYTIVCTVSMDSGLTAKSSVGPITVAWSDEAYTPNAEIGIDKDSYVAYIRPYCEDDDENQIDGVLLAVYRREYDGRFTELYSGLRNLDNMFFTDPHPALDYARYRIVATTEATGAVSYYDVAGYSVGGSEVIIQWDEDWSLFDGSTVNIPEKPTWAGSMLKLPYNIDVSNNHKMDVSLVEYIGRSHPVTYYGTQLGETATWNVEIPKTDVDTLYAIRRLAIWRGDVYVREPSGSGYWANITVSYSQKHNDLTIPITFNITRVEGGI